MKNFIVCDTWYPHPHIHTLTIAMSNFLNELGKESKKALKQVVKVGVREELMLDSLAADLKRRGEMLEQISKSEAEKKAQELHNQKMIDDRCQQSLQTVTDKVHMTQWTDQDLAMYEVENRNYNANCDTIGRRLSNTFTADVGTTFNRNARQLGMALKTQPWSDTVLREVYAYRKKTQK